MSRSPHGRDAAVDALVAAGIDGDRVVVTGPRGVGRTAVLHEVAARLAASGRRVDRIAGTRATRREPLAAMAPLLPNGEVAADLLVAATVRLLGADADRRTVVVDDVHLLDAQSLAVVAAIAVQSGPSLLLGAPSGSLPGVLEELVAAGHVTDHPLSPLQDVAPLLAAAGHHEVPADEVGVVTEGLPGLVTAWSADRAAGDVATGAPASCVGPRFVAAGRRHLDHVPPELVEALEVVAVGEPLPLDVAQDLLGEMVAELEARDAVAVDTVTQPPVVTITGASVGLALRTGLGRVRRRSIVDRLARAVLQARAVPPGSRAEAADHLLRAGVCPTSLDLTTAAADARDASRAELALELAHAALESGAGTEARRVLGDALARLGHREEAERVLADTATGTADPEAVRIRARNLAYGFDAPERALQVLRSLEVHDGSGQVLADQTLYATMLGDREQVVALTDRLLGLDVPPPVRLTALVHRTLVDALAGDADAADERLDEAERLADDLVAQLPTARAQVRTNRLLTLVGRGRVVDALPMATTTAAGARGSDVELLARFNEAYLRHLAGDVSGGLAALDDADDVVADPFGLRGSLAALRVRLTADAGRADPAAVEAVHAAPPTTAPRVVLWDAWARAVARLDGGTPEQRAGAVAALREAADRLEAAAHRMWAAELLHLAVRRGHADAVVDDLDRVAASTPASRFVDLLGAHARAVVARDHAALLPLARSLADGGMVLLAAEAAATASVLAPDGSQPARRAATLGAALSRDLRGAATPALAARTRGLTDRELDVARLAPTHTSREAGQVLHISTRTADNHLHAVYRKLGLDGREDLGKLLGPAVLPGPTT